MTVAARTPPTLAGPYSVTEAVDRLLAVAASQIGYREGRSKSGDWNNDNAYGLWFGTNGVSWCAQFVSWCAAQAGYLGTAIPKHQYTPTGWNWFVAHNRDVARPQRGDLLYVYGMAAGVRRVHHIGIVEKVLPGNKILSIEGNTNTSGASQGLGVFRLQRAISPRLKFARPNYALVVKTRPPGSKVQAQPRVTALSTKALVYAATKPSMSGVWGAHRLAAMSTLKVLGMTKSVYPPSGTAWDKHFRATWKRWQLSLGYKGTDADGIPGDSSVDKLCRRAGYKHLP